MASMSMGTSADAEKPSVLHGQWWLPSDPSRRYGGTLEFDSESGGALRIHGGLVVGQPPALTEVILGSTDKGDVTLPRASLAGWNRRGQDSSARTSSETWQCFEVFVGAHWPQGDDTAVAAAYVVTQALAHWVVGPPIHHENTYDPLTAHLSVQIPDRRVAELSDATLTLGWHDGYRFTYLRSEVVLNPTFTYETHTSLRASEVWRRCVYPLVTFLSLATGRADSVADLYLQEAGPYVIAPRVKVLRSQQTQPITGHVSPWEFLIPFPDVDPRFSEVLSLWFSLMQTHAAPLDEFFAIHLAQNMYLDERFNRICRALEVLHRQRYGGTLIPEAEYETVLKTVKAALGKEAWRVVSMRLNFGNEPTQADRLRACVELSAHPLPFIINSYDKFVRRTVDKRNELTHGLPGKYRPIGDELMAWAEQHLLAVMETLLVSLLGYDGEAISQRFMQTRRFRVLSSLNNAWALDKAAQAKATKLGEPI